VVAMQVLHKDLAPGVRLSIEARPTTPGQEAGGCLTFKLIAGSHEHGVRLQESLITAEEAAVLLSGEKWESPWKPKPVDSGPGVLTSKDFPDDSGSGGSDGSGFDC
jgi:hypothetical protein